MLTLAALNASMIDFAEPFGFGEDHAHALRALQQLDDDGHAADLLDHVLGLARPVREGGDGQADALAGEQLQRAQLVARAADGDALVQRVDALHLELAQHGEAVVRDGGADARDDRVVDRQAAPVVAQHRLVGGDVHVDVERVHHVDGVAARARRLAQAHVRVQLRIAGEHHEAHRAPLEHYPLTGNETTTRAGPRSASAPIERKVRL